MSKKKKDPSGGGVLAPKSHCNRDGSAVHCLARSEVQSIQMLFVKCRVCFVELVHKQLRCASDLYAS